MSEKILVFFRITDGHILNSIFKIIQAEINGPITMDFTSKGFVISLKNSNQNAIHDFKILGDEINKYEYNHGKKNLCIKLGAKEMSKALGAIKKKDWVQIIYGENARELLIQCSSENNLYVSCSTNDEITNTISSNFQSMKPDFKIEVKDLLDICVASKGNSCDLVILSLGLDSEDKMQLFFEGKRKDQSLGFTKEYSMGNNFEEEMEGDSEEDLLVLKTKKTSKFEISIPASFFKSISKIGDLANLGSSIRIYKNESEKNLIMRFAIYNIGWYTICIREIDAISNTKTLKSKK